MSELKNLERQLQNLKQAHKDLKQEYTELYTVELDQKEEKLRNRIKELKSEENHKVADQGR